MPRIRIEIQQSGRWHHVQTASNEAGASQNAQKRARSSGKRHRLVDEDGRVLDIIEP